MFAYNPTVNDTSGAILGQGVMGAADTRAKAQVKMVDDIGGALVGLAGAYAGASAKNKDAKELFQGNYRFLQERQMLTPGAQSAIDTFIGKNNYQAANATIAPYLAELDFGRKATLSGRSGFFDDSGRFQTAIVPELAPKRNKSGFVVTEN